MWWTFGVSCEYNQNMKTKTRRLILAISALIMTGIWVAINPASYEKDFEPVVNDGAMVEPGTILATTVLEKLEVKGRAPKTGYNRKEFYNNWPTVDGCNLRQRIIKREFGDTAMLDGCTVIAGEFEEPYTGEYKKFSSKEEIAKGIQIDHVVALSDAWQKGAQYLSKETRYKIATDPLNLLAVDGPANEQKSDGDAVKYKYKMWVTEAEKTAISDVLSKCPNEPVVGIESLE